MSNIQVTIEGAKEFQKALEKSPAIVAAEVNPAIKKTILRILAIAIPKIPVNQGFLHNANDTKFSNFEGVLENRAPYAMFVHGDGTADRSKPHWPPMDAIQRWAELHNIPAFLVARSIARKGTKLIPFYADAVKDANPEIDQIFKTALNNITLKLATL